MPKIMEHVDGLQRKAVLAFMGMMEQIHAKSYSSIFTTLAATEEIDEIFSWVEQNPYLQKKAEMISSRYQEIHTQKDLYMAMVASVFWKATCSTAASFIPSTSQGKAR